MNSNRRTCINPRTSAGNALSSLMITSGSFIVIMLCLPGCSKQTEQVSGQPPYGTAQTSPGAVAPTGQPESVVQGPQKHSLLSATEAQQQEQMQQEAQQQEQPPEGSQQQGDDMSTGSSNVVTTPSGLQFEDLQVGNGPCPKEGQLVSVHYTGWLTNGTKFDSSVDRGQPFQFTIGKRQVIAGWDEGVLSMQVGGRRKLIIPANLGYGDRGAGGLIPPGATLVFEVELLGVQ